jgi:hypothetical protein
MNEWSRGKQNQSRSMVPGSEGSWADHSSVVQSNGAFLIVTHRKTISSRGQLSLEAFLMRVPHDIS